MSGVSTGVLGRASGAGGSAACGLGRAGVTCWAADSRAGDRSDSTGAGTAPGIGFIQSPGLTVILSAGAAGGRAGELGGSLVVLLTVSALTDPLEKLTLRSAELLKMKGKLLPLADPFAVKKYRVTVVPPA